MKNKPVAEMTDVELEAEFERLIGSRDGGARAIARQVLARLAPIDQGAEQDDDCLALRAT